MTPRTTTVTVTETDLATLKLDNGWGKLPTSEKSKRTFNPIRAIVDPIVAGIAKGGIREDGKDHISLSIGDPTVGGNLPPCPVAIADGIATLECAPHAAGYVNAAGAMPVRRAVAEYHSTANHTVDPDQVLIASGCSGALELVLTGMLDEDSILLVPQPGFPLYEVIAKSHGAQVEHYRLDPDNGWQVDFLHLNSIMEQHGERVRGIVVCNPSNPTGAVFSRSHLQMIVKACERFRLPIIADEVYGDLVHSNNTYHPMADVAAELGHECPVITVSGIGKQFLLPGWRIGWAIFQDNIHGSLADVEEGCKKLSQIILGASHLAQSVVPALLDKENPEIKTWKDQLKNTLEHQSNHLAEKLCGIKGLEVIPAGGAMYLMVRIKLDHFDAAIDSDVSFSKLLLEEENVFALPGSCFGSTESVFRCVICAPPEVLEEAAARIEAFCVRHDADNVPPPNVPPTKRQVRRMTYHAPIPEPRRARRRASSITSAQVEMSYIP